MPYVYDCTHLGMTSLCWLLLIIVSLVHLQRIRSSRSKRSQTSNSLRKSSSSVSPSSHISSIVGSTLRSISFSFPVISDELERKQKIGEIMASVTVLLSIAMMSVALWMRLSYFRATPTPVQCPAMALTIAVLFCHVRSCLYCVLINRFDLAFSNTQFAYKKKTVNLCYVIVFLVYLIWLIWTPFGIKAEDHRWHYGINGQRISKKEDSLNKNDKRKRMGSCITKPHPLLSLFTVMFDVVFVAIMVYMFVVPLRRLFSSSDNDNSDNNNHNNNENDWGWTNKKNNNDDSIISAMGTTDLGPRIIKKSKNDENRLPRLSLTQVSELEMKLLPVKYCLLSSLCVFTTMAALLVLAVTGYGMALTLDTTATALGLLLMTNHWSREYWMIFGPLLLSLHSMGVVGQSTHSRLVMLADYYGRNGYDKRKPISNRKRATSVSADSMKEEEMDNVESQTGDIH